MAAAAATAAALQALQGGTTQAAFYRDVSAAAQIPDGVVEPAENPNALPGGGPKVCSLVSPAPADSELAFLAQMGVTHAFAWFPGDDGDVTVERLVRLRERVEAAGLALYNVGCLALGKSRNIILGTEKRDEDIARMAAFIRALGAAGIRTTVFTWEGSGLVYSTGTAAIRGGARGRYLDAGALAGVEPVAGRLYSEEELWANLEYYLGRILPVAKEAGVRLALHPNDPPMPAVGGVPHIIRSREAYERVFRIANDSPMLGMEFCCGCWLEGGAAFGDVYGAIADFVRRGKVFIVHFRNVTSPLPRFAETFLDAGYGDMYRLMRTLVRSGYAGTVILDHTPPLTHEAGPGAATAFALGYIKASLRAATAEMQGCRE